MDFLNAIVKPITDVQTDVHTSVTRVVTDTAIDLANVATLFSFDEHMEAAKKKMSDAGLRSVADVIEKNHYGFLKDMEKEAHAKYDYITHLCQEAQHLELKRNKWASVLEEMLNDVDLLAQMSTEAEKLLEKASKIPDWQKWNVSLKIPIALIQTISKSAKKWDEISHKLLLAGMTTSVASGVTGVMSGLSTIGKASKLLSAGSTVGKASKFIKVAARASVVLTIASFGFDIGLSIAELESKKAKLEENLKKINDEIAEVNRDITGLQQDLREINLRIYQLLNSVEPAQTEESWESWVEATKEELKQARSSLLSFESIRTKAIEVAKLTKGESYEYRVKLIASINLAITENEAKSIIADVDKE